MYGTVTGAPPPSPTLQNSPPGPAEKLYQERTNLEKANSSLVNQVHRHAPDI